MNNSTIQNRRKKPYFHSPPSFDLDEQPAINDLVSIVQDDTYR